MASAGGMGRPTPVTSDPDGSPSRARRNSDAAQDGWLPDGAVATLAERRPAVVKVPRVPLRR